MNARQKAKKYKRLYEELGKQKINPLIIKTEYPIVHLRCCQIVPDQATDEITDGINRVFYDHFFKEIIQFIKVIKSEKVMGGERLTGDLWVVDRRLYP